MPDDMHWQYWTQGTYWIRVDRGCKSECNGFHVTSSLKFMHVRSKKLTLHMIFLHLGAHFPRPH